MYVVSISHSSQKTTLFKYRTPSPPPPTIHYIGLIITFGVDYTNTCTCTCISESVRENAAPRDETEGESELKLTFLTSPLYIYDEMTDMTVDTTAHALAPLKRSWVAVDYIIDMLFMGQDITGSSPSPMPPIDDGLWG